MQLSAITKLCNNDVTVELRSKGVLLRDLLFKLQRKVLTSTSER